MQEKKTYDLKINVLSSDLIPPRKNNYKNIWLNLYGIKEINQDLIKYFGELACSNSKATILILNANVKIKEQLRFFIENFNAKYVS